MVYSGGNLDYSKKITIFYKFIFIYYNIMNMKTKTFFALVLAGAFSVLWVSASETTSSTSTFSLSEVKVASQNSVSISFNKDVLEDVSFFEFLLTPASDDTKEITLSDLTLTAPNVLTATTAEALQASTDYNLVVVFASDKDGSVIENWVDGMVTFTTPATFEGMTSVEGGLNAAPSEANVSMETTLSVPSEMNVDSSASMTEAAPVNTEVAAANAEALPQTGPTEILFVVLALLLGLGISFMRKNA